MRMLLTGAISWNESQKNEIRILGHEILYIQDERIPLYKQNIEAESVEGVICNGLFLYNDISCFKNLKYIQLTSAGFDQAPMEYIKEHKIEIRNARGVYSVPMAEFALAGVLQIYKQSRFFYKNQKQRQWLKNRDILELFGKNVCIVGCGSVGTECAKRFQAFGCNVIGVDLYPREDSNYKKMQGLEQLEVVLPNSDIVILTVPLTENTRFLMNEQKFDLMKKEAVLVNISRGAVVDTKALINKMPDLGGAVLDVFEEEPLPEKSSLWAMDNVIITPHNCFVGEENRNRLQKVIIDGLTEERQ